jgi:hypothetical protein
MIRPSMDHANQVTALIKELLIPNSTERAAATNLQKLQREMLVMQNHIEQ